MDEGPGRVVKTLSIETTTHGRVLVRETRDPEVTLVGFHGYFENAEIQMARLESIPGAEGWTLVSAQGLHRFYRGRSEDVVASWMTRQDREEMIADNLAYADRIVEAAVPAGVPIVTVGFSQGVAMAFRAAVRGRRPAIGVVAVGGDIPPELLAVPDTRFAPTLLLRGDADPWYTVAKLESDVAALRARGALVEAGTYSAGHDWTPETSEAAAAFIVRNGRTTQ